MLLAVLDTFGSEHQPAPPPPAGAARPATATGTAGRRRDHDHRRRPDHDRRRRTRPPPTTAAATRTTTAATRTTGHRRRPPGPPGPRPPPPPGHRRHRGPRPPPPGPRPPPPRTAATAAALAATTAAAEAATTARATAATATRTAAATATGTAATTARTAATTAATTVPAGTAVAASAIGSLRGGLVHDRQVGAGVALGHDLALVDPALDADPAEGRASLVEAVVDVGAQRVQRDAAVGVALGARHLGAAQAAGDLDLDALGARAHGAGQRALHGAAEGDAVLQLLGDRLRHQARVELGALDLEDVDLDLLVGDAVQVTPQLVDLGARLADHDAGARRVDVDLDLGGVLADRDVRQPGVGQPADDVLADLRVLVQEVGEVALVEPVRLPVVDVAHADRFGMNFLTHVLCLVASSLA